MCHSFYYIFINCFHFSYYIFISFYIYIFMYFYYYIFKCVAKDFYSSFYFHFNCLAVHFEHSTYNLIYYICCYFFYQPWFLRWSGSDILKNLLLRLFLGTLNTAESTSVCVCSICQCQQISMVMLHLGIMYNWFNLFALFLDRLYVAIYNTFQHICL